MSLSARVPAGADTAGFVPEIWSQQVLDVVEMNLVCWDAIDFRWQTDLKKGDTVNIGIINDVTATEVVVGNKHASLDPSTGSKKQLVVDQWFEAPVDVDDMTMLQSQIDWPSKARARSAYAIAKKMDTSVATLFSALGGYSATAYGSDGQTLTDDILLAIKETLMEADVPWDGNISLILDPSALTDLMKIDKFISAQYTAIGAVNNGMIGTSPIYGCKVRVTNNLVTASTGSFAVMMHRDAIAGAAQMQPSWMQTYRELHTTRYQTEALWGVLEVRDNFGIPFYTRKA